MGRNLRCKRYHEASYNCFPENPATQLLDELARRADRSVEEVISQESRDGND